MAEISQLFTVEMDNDLNAEAAVNNVNALLEVLLRRRDEISPEQARRIRDELTRVDHVLQVLDLAD